MFTLICARMGDWVNNREAGDLRRYLAHYDVIVMIGKRWWSAQNIQLCVLSWPPSLRQFRTNDQNKQPPPFSSWGQTIRTHGHVSLSNHNPLPIENKRWDTRSRVLILPPPFANWRQNKRLEHTTSQKVIPTTACFDLTTIILPIGYKKHEYIAVGLISPPSFASLGTQYHISRLCDWCDCHGYTDWGRTIRTHDIAEFLYDRYSNSNSKDVDCQYINTTYIQRSPLCLIFYADQSSWNVMYVARQPYPLSIGGHISSGRLSFSQWNVYK